MSLLNTRALAALKTEAEQTMTTTDGNLLVWVRVGDGPAPDAAEVWADHNPEYTVDFIDDGPETATYKVSAK